MGTSRNVAGDLIEMKLHGFGVGVWQDQCCTGSACRTDGAEEIGILVTLVGWLAGPRPASGPLADEAILLADPGFILEPNLDRCCLWQVGKMDTQRSRDVFLNAAMVSASCPG